MADEITREEKLTRERNPVFYKLWDLKYPREGEKGWYNYEIYAKTTKDVEMSVWNGKSEPSVEHICKAGTRVRVWMVSRFGDAGITDNLIDPIGYNARGLNADVDLIDYEFIEKKNDN
jgi:hypothetical protein